MGLESGDPSLIESKLFKGGHLLGGQRFMAFSIFLEGGQPEQRLDGCRELTKIKFFKHICLLLN